MIDLVRSLVLLLMQLLERLEKREYDKEQKRRQDARDRAEKDPAQYLRDEFGGLRNADTERDASETDKADAHKRVWFGVGHSVGGYV